MSSAIKKKLPIRRKCCCCSRKYPIETRVLTFVRCTVAVRHFALLLLSNNLPHKQLRNCLSLKINWAFESKEKTLTTFQKVCFLLFFFS